MILFRSVSTQRVLKRALPFTLASSVTSVLLSMVPGCSGTKSTNQPAFHEGAAEQAVPQEASGSLAIPSGSLPVLSAQNEYRLPGGRLVASQVIGGETYIKVSAAITDPSFKVLLEASSARGLSSQEKKQFLGATLVATVKAIDQTVQILSPEINADVGYFSAWVKVSDYSALSRVGKLPAGIVLNPVVLDETKLPTRPRSLNEALDGRLDSAGYSGLKRIGAPEFAAKVKDEVGAEPDGSKVLVGVADTGVTLNHPSFTDAAGKSRIEYMKEFTGEGTAYFSPLAQFEVRIPKSSDLEPGINPKEALFITADYLTAPIGLGTRPAGDKFQRLENQLILVDSALKALLTNPSSGVRLGVVSEESFNAPSEQVDINKNGSTKDPLWVLLVPGSNSSEHTFYVDLSGTGDFRNAQIVRDWNATRTTINAYSETFGFDVSSTELAIEKQTDGKQTVTAIRAGVIGFDPGNHGSHVTGIIAGRKTIANDNEDTLARGVAPAARIAVNRVCANNGGCAAVEAVIDLAQNGADLINMSLGGLNAFNDGYDVDDLMINRLIQLYNTQFLISAGNSGPGRNTVGSPSVARLSLSIGATANQEMIQRQYQWPGFGKGSDSVPALEDFLLFFSSRGPTAAGGFKPTLTAPGTELSAVQLNSAPGAKSGLDVYWGTSMAAPTASGAYALLLDAVRKYNEKFPNTTLAQDPLTLRRVLIESARPFDVKKFDPKTGTYSDGQYTWIDQGAGMLNLPAAWELLKKISRESVPPSFLIDKEPGKPGSQIPVALDYQVRVLRKNPNGIRYDGSLTGQSPIGLDPSTTQAIAKIGTGIWFDAAQTDSLVEVQIARRLPENLLNRSDAGSLNRMLVTTKDDFELETTIYGSKVNWLKAGALNSLDCNNSNVLPKLSVIGEGAVDVPATDEAPGTSTAFRVSSLYVCADRQAMKSLPPGDHGALIKAYRTVNGVREAAASFIVPVYVTVPNQKLANKKNFETSGIVKSFQVKRNYIEIPTGTTLVRVEVEVPKAKLENGVLSECSGVALYALEAGNTVLPPEFADRTQTIAKNCSDSGLPLDDFETRSIVFERTNPNPGIWDLHIFGRYNFASSAYTMKVNYANLESDKKEIKGDKEALKGELNVSVKSASFEVQPSAENTTYTLDGLAQTVTEKIKEKESLAVPNKASETFRSYDKEIGSVTIDTFGSAGNDIDLQILECTSKEISSCSQIATSGTATDIETATFTPKAEAFYVAVVQGFKVPEGEAQFTLKETKFLKSDDAGTVNIEETASGVFKVQYQIDIANSKILAHPDFVSGSYDAVGSLELRSTTSSLLTKLPVTVTAHSQQ